MNEVVSMIEAVTCTDQCEHTDILDALDFGEATAETKQPGSPFAWDNQVGQGLP